MIRSFAYIVVGILMLLGLSGCGKENGISRSSGNENVPEYPIRQRLESISGYIYGELNDGKYEVIAEELEKISKENKRIGSAQNEKPTTAGPAALLMLGDLFVKNNKHTKAEECYLALAERYDDQPMDKPGEGAKDYYSDHAKPVSYSRLMLLYKEMNNIENAIKYFHKTVVECSDDIYIPYEGGYLFSVDALLLLKEFGLSKERLYSEMLKGFNESKSDIFRAKTLYMIGEEYQGQKNFIKAIEFYSRTEKEFKDLYYSTYVFQGYQFCIEAGKNIVEIRLEMQKKKEATEALNALMRNWESFLVTTTAKGWKNDDLDTKYIVLSKEKYKKEVLERIEKLK